jgi:anaerobic ribonucleoside-triphosphate reductase activating protein
MLYINRIAFPVTALGFGRRLGVWLQGCSIGCPGCMSPELQAFDPARIISAAELFKLLEGYAGQNPDGLTVSGGEPFEQPEGLEMLLDIWTQLGSGDVVVYSGYEFSQLHATNQKLLDRIDILIDGQFVETLPTEKVFRGSDNQRIHLLSRRSRERYGCIDFERQTYNQGTRRMQFDFKNGEVVIIGIPRRGDLERLRTEMLVLENS